AAPPGLAALTSPEARPEIRAYDRVSPTVLTAYAHPLARRYLGRLREGLAGAGATKAAIHLMTSSGALTTTEEAERGPVRLVESGPAGGCLAAVFHSRHLRMPDLVVFDMGGTTAKACLIHR